MSTKKKILISTIAVLTLVLGGVMVTHADGDTPSSEDLISTGRTEIDVDNDGIPDAVFDAKDLKDIATSVENGKSSLATSINAYPNADVAPLATFLELSSAIDNLTAVPDIYYYDKATEGDSCVRYMYEEGSYYPCNEYGEKTSDTALSGTITVVAKDDTTAPGAGEIQLVKYESTGAGNLSAGAAGYVDKSLYLGSGSDNITFRNQGYLNGYDDGLAQNNIIITRHEHNDRCYCLGNMVVYEKLTIGSGDNKYHLRVRCSSCGATAQNNSNINWYNSYSIGDVYESHYYCYFAFISGQKDNKLCAYDNNQIISIKINGTEYLN